MKCVKVQYSIEKPLLSSSPTATLSFRPSTSPTETPSLPPSMTVWNDGWNPSLPTNISPYFWQGQVSAEGAIYGMESNGKGKECIFYLNIIACIVFFPSKHKSVV